MKYLEAFVYCWTDKKTNMLYVGFHKGSTDESNSRKGEKNPNFGKVSTEKNKKWYFNVNENKSLRFIEGSQPVGWILGRK